MVIRLEIMSCQGRTKCIELGGGDHCIKDSVGHRVEVQWGKGEDPWENNHALDLLSQRVRMGPNG